MRHLGCVIALALALAGCKPALGSRCKTHDDCAGLENGYCARAEICTRECVPGSSAAKEKCPREALCVEEGRRHVCLELCAADSDCEPGFSCQQLADGAVCRYVDPFVVPAPLPK